jgi:hypothetical protein
MNPGISEGFAPWIIRAEKRVCVRLPTNNSLKARRCRPTASTLPASREEEASREYLATRAAAQKMADFPPFLSLTHCSCFVLMLVFTYSVGPSASVEFPVIKDWLEIEAGISLLFRPGANRVAN